METDRLNDLVYQKYEQFSVQYIMNIYDIKKLIETYVSHSSNLDNLDDYLNKMIREKFYYNITTTIITNFDQKLKHNIGLAQKSNDLNFFGYMSRKFGIKENMSLIDLNVWEYKSQKIKLKLKIGSTQSSYFTTKPLLADLIGIDNDQKFKYKSDIMKLIHQYINENQLQDRTNKIRINPDQHLTKILSPLENDDWVYTYYNLPNYVNHMII